jgi:hypothetical protein
MPKIDLHVSKIGGTSGTSSPKLGQNRPQVVDFADVKFWGRFCPSFGDDVPLVSLQPPTLLKLGQNRPQKKWLE